jgi:Predicted SPOUT methyltransferase
MRIYLISVARRVPPWVRAAYEDYAVRLPARCALGLIEVTAERRRRGRDTQRPLGREGERVLKAIPPSAWVVALDEHGAGARPIWRDGSPIGSAWGGTSRSWLEGPTGSIRAVSGAPTSAGRSPR